MWGNDPKQDRADYLPNGEPPVVATVFKNLDLAKTYRLIASQGTNGNIVSYLSWESGRWSGGQGLMPRIPAWGLSSHTSICTFCYSN